MRDSQQYKIMAAKAANGIGSSVFCEDYKTSNLSLNTTGNANLTIKIQISQQELMPDFSAAASSTNQWTYSQIINLTDGTSINGNTGIVLTGTDVTGNQYEININGATWFNAIISSYVAGSVNLNTTIFDNE